MIGRPERNLLRNWMALLALTAVSVASVSLATFSTMVALVLCLALLKARIVVFCFMGLEGHPALARALVGWCALLAAGAAARAVLFAALPG